ncbi:MAG: hypothetical protein ACLQGU_05185 [bacterium]
MKAIPTKYGGTTFRSKLEASYAKTLDLLTIKWTYETNGFDLGSIKYLPDFWLPDIRTFLEVKGPFIPGAEKARELSKKVEDDWWDPSSIVIIGNELGKMKTADGEEEVALLKCRKCGKYWFASVSRSYACRNCGMHDGDHHIEEWHNNLDLAQINI